MAVEVQILDLDGFFLVAVLLSDGVIEVLVSCSHAAPVQSGRRASTVKHVVGAIACVLITDSDHCASADLQFLHVRIAQSRTGLEVVTPHPLEFVGQEEDRQPAVG